MIKSKITLMTCLLLALSLSMLASAEEIIDIETGETITLDNSVAAKNISGKMAAAGTETSIDLEMSELVNVDGIECGLGTEYRFATNNQIDGKNLEVLLKIGSKVAFANSDCIQAIDGRFYLRLRAVSGVAFAELTMTIVEAGTRNIVKSDSILMTSLDLDTVGDDLHSTDDIYVDGATTLLVSPDSKVIAQNRGILDFFGGYNFKLKGNPEGNCNDQLSNRDLTCSGAALWDSAGIGIGEIDFKIQNDNSPNSNRLFIVSFKLIDAVGLDNRPPVAVLDGFPTSGVAPLVSSFNASNSTDEDGEIVSYTWDFGDGSTSEDIVVDHTYSSEGSYTVTLTITDNDGASATDQILVEVGEQSDTTPPNVRINGNALVFLRLDGTYDELGATAIDDRDGPVSVTISDDIDVNTVGNYTVTYSATDSAGNIGTATREVRIDLPLDSTPPVITLNGSQTITINVGDSFTDPGATAVDDTDGSVNVSPISNVDTSVAGEYTLTYTASDSSGNISQVNRTVIVNAVIGANIAPNSVINSNTTAGVGPLSIDFDGSASNDSDGEIVSYSWDFGNMTTAATATTSQVYTDAGEYVVTLTVTDNDGASSSSTTTITVNVEAEIVSYLKIVDTEGGYHHLKIGHNPDNLWQPKVSPADGNTSISIRLRADGNVDWSKIELVPQSQDWRGIVSLGDYIDGNPQGWIDVSIPLSDYPAGAFDDITLLSFFTRGIDPFSMSIERIEFIGNNNFLWFGAPDKLDVAFDTPWNASVVTVDPSGPTHLQVIDRNGGWQHLKIGHNPDNLWNPKISPIRSNNAITLRVKSGPGVDWNKLQLVPQGNLGRGSVTLGNHLPADTSGWFDIVIPIAEFGAGGALDAISLLSIFSNGSDPFEFGLARIAFTGGTEFIWFDATTNVSLETDWFTQLVVSSEAAGASTRISKSGLKSIQQPTIATAPAAQVNASTGGGGSMAWFGLFGLLLSCGVRRSSNR